MRDSGIGGHKFEELCQVMRQSRKIIIVVSNSFLERPECNSEAAFAGKLIAIGVCTVCKSLKD